MKTDYKATIYACYIGYVTQAIVNNLAPILFIIFQTQFEISFEMLGRIILFNFSIQLLVDIITVKVVHKVGYRKLIIFAHFCSFLGLLSLALLPNLLSNAYLGMVISVMIYAIGGGIIEVLVSPIVESVPGDDKAGAMSLLHSFYCWGQVAVVLFTTIALVTIGRDKWMFLTAAWSLVPLYNMFKFMKVPLMATAPEGKHMPLKELFNKDTFIIALILMVCAGASELTISQWSSLFAEKSLGVSKVVGDILGPCLFAVLMGVGRTIYGIWGNKIKLDRALEVSAILCVACYIIAVLSPVPIISLLACGGCGFSVSLMWPGTFSHTARQFPLGGAAMFGVLAVFGDLGCAIGPWISGLISDFVSNLYSGNAIADQIGLKLGLGFGIVFPIVMFICLWTYNRKNKKLSLI